MRAEQMTIEPASTCAPDPFRAEGPLDSSRNPFVSGAPSSRLGRPAQTVFAELVRLIGLRTRVVVVLGNAGTGKTMLVSMAAGACADMALSVRRVERGDLLTEAAGDTSDVLFVDEADSMSNAVLQSFLSASGGHADTTMVFMCLPSCISRFSFSGTEATVLELTPLSLLDARLYLTERGNSIGRPNLFTLRALDLIIDASRGVPRLLRSIAGIAYFNAAVEGASHIDARHATAAAHMRNEFGPAPSGAPNGLSACSEAAEINDRPEYQAADPEAEVVEASAEATDAVAANKLQTPLLTEVFGGPEAARYRWQLRKRRSVVALGMLLIVGAGVFAFMSGHTPRNTLPQEVSSSPTVAVAPPAEEAASQPASEGAPPTIVAPTQSASEANSAPSQSAPEADAAPTPSVPAADSAPTESASAVDSKPTQSGPPSSSASTKSGSHPEPTKTEDPSICALWGLSRDPRALPISGRCPGAQRAFPGRTVPGPTVPPPIRRAAEVAPKSAVPATDAATAAQGTPAEPVRTTESTPPQAQSPSEAPTPPAAMRSDLPAVAADKVQTQGLGEVARAAQGTPEQRAALPREPDHSPIVIFGFRLW